MVVMRSQGLPDTELSRHESTLDSNGVGNSYDNT
jgi:hypothetical protein